MVRPHEVPVIEFAPPAVIPWPDVLVKIVLVISAREVLGDEEEMGLTKQRSFQRIKIHSLPNFSSIHLALPRLRDMISSSSASLFDSGSVSAGSRL